MRAELDTTLFVDKRQRWHKVTAIIMPFDGFGYPVGSQADVDSGHSQASRPLHT